MTNTIQIQSAQDITNAANVAYYVDKIKNEMTVATGPSAGSRVGLCRRGESPRTIKFS